MNASLTPDQSTRDERAEAADLSPLTRIVDIFLRGDVAVLLTVVSLLLGLVALQFTPREEEPQIVVPMADILISAPGLAAEEVEQQVTTPLERLLVQIDGVEHVYSQSSHGEAVVTVRFFVGEDREDSLIKLHSKVQSGIDRVPAGVAGWVLQPVEVDDVPIVIATLWSNRPGLYGDHELRRLAEEIRNDLQQIRNTNRVTLVGGRPRKIRVELNAAALAGRRVSPLQVAEALRAGNVSRRAGEYAQQDRQFLVDAGTFFRNADELRDLVVAVVDERPVYLRDVARVLDGPAEPESWTWIGFGPANTDPRIPAADDHHAGRDAEAAGGRRGERSSGSDGVSGVTYPAVQIAVAKRRGTNAVDVADAVLQRLDELEASLLPDGVQFRVTRNYGETANEKVNELVEGLAVAVLTVVALIGMVLGWRAALVIALAIPVCYSLTLFINLMAGYTINRVTMFALILALGLLVDDPITDVENISRYFSQRVLPPRLAVLRAIQEVRPALILSTLAIIASFLPLAFITGMMGPYMAPMALNVPLTVTLSTVVAFVLTPWLAMVSLRRLSDQPAADEESDITRQLLYRFFRRVLTPALERRGAAVAVLGATAALLGLACLLPVLRLIPLKMLPYDNKNEFQIIVDLPEGTTLERTDAVARRIGRAVAEEAEVRDYVVTTGTASPMDFNGLVRHYFLRRGPNVADIRVTLAPKDVRQHQSHEIVLRIRDRLTQLAAAEQARIKLVESPPGPPVLSTITAEVYGPADAAYEDLIQASRSVADRLRREPGVVDVDVSAEDDQVVRVFRTDKERAALSEMTTETIAATLQTALAGSTATVLHRPTEVNPLLVELRLPLAQRSATDDLSELYVVGASGQLVQLSSLGEFEEQTADKSILHKNLRRVAFVYAEVAGRAPADAIADLQFDRRDAAAQVVELTADGRAAGDRRRPVSDRTWLTPGGGDPWQVADGIRVEWAGEGEWQITLDVFRDLGLAFVAALAAIFVILMFQTGSRLLPPVIMLAIPLTLIGILPGFWLLNLVTAETIGGAANPVFFTATAMIGMIALAGIVVRNSVVLIDFIHLGLAEGLPLQEAIIRSVAVRTRPILLTAATTLLGNAVITLDPIFSGLAWAIIFGIATSTLFTLIVIPVVYRMLYGPPWRAARS